MKWLSVLVTLAATWLLASCNEEGPERNSLRVVSVAYEAWDQSISIEDGDLKLIRVEHEYDNPVSGTPSGSTRHVVAEGAVAEATLEALAADIVATGFFELEAAYGAPEDQRYYPYELSVKLSDGREHTVIYRSNPDYDPSPEALEKIKGALIQISKGL